jgi:FkbM family methyltransferase
MWKRRETLSFININNHLSISQETRGGLSSVRCTRGRVALLAWFVVVSVTLMHLFPSLIDYHDSHSFIVSSSSPLEEHKSSLRYMGNKKTNTGWNIDTLCLHPNNKHNPIIVYGVGAGEDISWDIGMIEEYGATVIIIDPTEKAKQHVESVLSSKDYKKDPNRVIFLNEGLSHEKGNIVFALPANPNHVSMRAVEMADPTMTQTVSAPVRTLQDFMSELGHDYLDVLKIDIEGAEYSVLESLIQSKFMPFTQLLVEYHDRFLMGNNEKRKRHLELLKKLDHAGFVELWSHNGGQERGYVKMADLKYCADGISKRFSWNIANPTT